MCVAIHVLVFHIFGFVTAPRNGNISLGYLETGLVNAATGKLPQSQ
jgi:hypothetical protein